MKLIPFIPILALLFGVFSCSTDKTNSDISVGVKPGNSKSVKNQQSGKVPDKTQHSEKLPDEREDLLIRVESNLKVLINFGVDLDHELIQDILIELSVNGLGYPKFVNYAAIIDPGRIPADVCLDFADEMIDGTWENKFADSITLSQDPQGIMQAVIFLSRSLESDYPDKSKQLLDLYLSLIDKIERPLFRVNNLVSAEAELYLAGFSDIPNLTVDALEAFIDVSNDDSKKISPGVILNLMADAAVVDYDEALNFELGYLYDDYLTTEGDAARAAGLMRSDYEKGKRLYVNALDNILKYEFNEESNRHTAFEFGFSNLNDDDRKKYIKKYFDVMKLYNRLMLLPPPEKGSVMVSEPEFPAWYRDNLFQWMNDNNTTEEKVVSLNHALSEHCARFPNSKNTAVFIGWALDWIEDMDQPFDRFTSLGRYLTMHRGIIPDNIAIARPRIFRLIESFKGKLDNLKLFDSLLEVVIYYDPVGFKEQIAEGSSVPHNPAFISGFISTLIARHYLFDEIDAGLASVVDLMAAEQMTADEMDEFKVYSDLAEIWAGWDNDKAWEYIELMDQTNGKFPDAIIEVAAMTKHYDPGFAARCADHLIKKYQSWDFKLSSPNMESTLVSKMAGYSLTSSEKLADIITKNRGNTRPDYSYYSLREIILIAAYNIKPGGQEHIRITNEIQNQLKEDLFKNEPEQ